MGAVGSKRFAKEISSLKMKLYDRDADAAAGADPGGSG
jgi:hypothetical protein